MRKFKAAGEEITNQILGVKELKICMLYRNHILFILSSKGLKFAENSINMGHLRNNQEPWRNTQLFNTRVINSRCSGYCKKSYL